MSDEAKCTILLTAWLTVFAVGMLIADSMSRPVGLLLMAFSTIYTATVFWVDSRIEAEKRRRRRYEEDCNRRAEEAHEEWLRR